MSFRGFSSGRRRRRLGRLREGLRGARSTTATRAAAAPRRCRRRPPAALQRQHGGDDATGVDLRSRRGGAARERGRDERLAATAARRGDEAVAEVAVVAHRAGGRADDARVVDVDGIGDDRRCRVGDRSGRGEDGDAVGDAEREAAPAPARGRDAAHRRRGVDGEAAVERQAGQAVRRVGDDADVERGARREVQCDVAAVVDGGARDAGSAEGADQLLGDAAGDRGHRRDEAAVVAMRTARRDHAPRDRPCGSAGAGCADRSARSSGSSATSSARMVSNRVHALPTAAATAAGSPSAPTMQSIGPCWKCQRSSSRRRAPHRRAFAHRCPPTADRSGQGTPGSAPITRQPPVARTSARRRTRAMWPPSAR